MGEFLRAFLETFLGWVDALGGWIIENRRPLTRIGAWVGGIIAVPVIAIWLMPSVLAFFAPPLNLTQDLYAVNRPVAFTFLDAKGEVVGHRGAIVGTRLTLEEMPAYLPAAFIAMEDRRFYSHHGIDPRGLLRAVWEDIKARRWVAGGSTITQQTAKIVFTDSGRNVSRKLTDMMDAAALEKSLSKKQILELYLNRIYLGSGSYGVDGAAHVYFGKSAKDLSLSEAAMLATLTRAPSVFSPRRDLARAQTRALIVLAAMVETGAITQEQADDAKAHPADVVDRAVVDARNFFLDTAADEARERASAKGAVLGGDLLVHTTLEPRIQEAAREAALKIIKGKAGIKAHASEAAVVVMKPDGAVSAMIGGADYDESTFNRATQAHRQPGSAFKPFVYLAALEAGLNPWDVRDDAPVDINGWTPTNFGGRAYGQLTLADALAHSVNTITANLAQEVGLDSVVEAAKRCGITSPLQANASLALGTSEVTPLELTSAYAAFASGGLKVSPYTVTEVDSPGGQVLYKRQEPEENRVIAEHVDRDLTAMLFGVVTEGTGRGASLWGREAAGKTGTTQDYHDAWFVGFTTDYVTGVWVGNDDSSAMRGVTGGSLPATIWRDVMTAAEKNLPIKPLDRSPPGAPVDETMMASGVPVVTADDEASNATPAEQAQQQQQERKSSGPVGGFLNWLFGSGEDKKRDAAKSDSDSDNN
jgi:penicillin-binding protein 1A